MIEQMTTQGFNDFQQIWLPALTNIYRSIEITWESSRLFETAESFYKSVDDFWGTKFRNKTYQAHIDLYRAKILEWIQDPKNINRTNQYPAIWSVIHKSKVAPHLINRNSFDTLFVPMQNTGSIIGFSLSTIFSKYKIDEFNWCINEYSSGRSANVEKAKAVFRRKIAPPWVSINNLLEQMNKTAGARDTFRFEVTTPSDQFIKIQEINQFTFQAQLRNKTTGDDCNFDHLSSGEKVLLALAISIFYANEAFMPPRALLLDEVDASLHPSMIKTLLEAVENAFVKNGTKVILATHSPSTVALSDSASLYFVETGVKTNKIRHISKAEALSLLSEGFLTFDEGLEALKFSGEHLIVFTEGDNRRIIERYFQLRNISGIKIIDSLDDKSGKEQLIHYYKLISALGLNRKSIFIWDCDALNIVNKLDETENLFKFVFPLNMKNNLAKSGIENALSESTLEAHCTITHDPDGNVHKKFSSNHKKKLADKISKSSDLTQFEQFNELDEKIKAILAS